MATRCMMAMDSADLHARDVLKKIARNRPLGDLHAQHDYTPPQPVLSCKTVDIDVCGTRTYRPKSSIQIIEEQHRLVHDIYTKTRQAKSAPSKRRSQGCEADNHQPLRRINIEVGRPATSQSAYTRKKRSPASRPKSTGEFWRFRESGNKYWIVPEDTELLDTSQSHKAYTSRIHKHWWLTDNENIGTDASVRSQSAHRSGEQSHSHWLTFSGQREPSSPRKFEPFTNREEYNIDGAVGDRVADYLIAGDDVRIGINGYLTPRANKSHHTSLTMEDSCDGPTQAVERCSVPLCWSDQLNDRHARIMEPKEPVIPALKKKPCGMQPVIFETLSKGGPLRPQCMTVQKSELFTPPFKHTTKTSSAALISQRLRNVEINSDLLTVNVLLQQRRNSTDVQRCPHLSGPKDEMPLRSSLKQETAELVSEKTVVFRADDLPGFDSDQDMKPQRTTTKLTTVIKPTAPSVQMYTQPDPDLQVTIPKVHTREIPSKSSQRGGKPLHKPVSAPSSNSHRTPADTEYIQITSGIKSKTGLPRAPSQTKHVKKADTMTASRSTIDTNVTETSSVRILSPDKAVAEPHVAEEITDDSQESMVIENIADMSVYTSSPVSTPRRVNTPVSASEKSSTFPISIPTAVLDLPGELTSRDHNLSTDKESNVSGTDKDESFESKPAEETSGGVEPNFTDNENSFEKIPSDVDEKGDDVEDVETQVMCHREIGG